VDFIKPRSAMDNYDTDISTTADTMVLIAIGNLNINMREKAMVSGENESIDFNTRERSVCFDAPPYDEKETVSWNVPFRIKSAKKKFEVRLGPPGGDKGYKAITGRSDPPFAGMCWWINGYLLPELTVHRGQTYYFKVQGGDSDDLGPANYHPFYITSDPQGGYGTKSENERTNEMVWAGVDMTHRYEHLPTAKGSLCYYKAREGEDKWREAETFKAYRASLEVVCERGSRDNYGLLNWTVAEATPDLVYYQSYTYEGLGWRIRVRDSGDSAAPAPHPAPLLALLLLLPLHLP